MRVRRPAYPQAVAKLPWDLRISLFAVQALFLTTVYSEIVGHATLFFVGSFNLTIAEPTLALSMATVIVLLVCRTPHFDFRILLLAAISSLTFMSFLRGLMVGPYEALFSLRANGPFTATLLLSCLLPMNPEFWSRIERTIVLAGLMLAGLAYLRLVLGPTFLIQMHFLDETAINDGGRALSSQGAVIIGAAVLLQMRQVWQQKGFSLVSLCILVPGLLLSRQATASLATMCGFVILISLQPGPTRPLRIWLAGLGIFLVLFCVLIVPSIVDPDTLEAVAPKAIVGDLLRRSQTLDTRQFVWAGLMRDFYGWSVEDQLFGLPAGVKPSIVIPLWGGLVWKASIHSMYFGLLPQIGIVGLALYLVLLLAFAARAFTLSMSSSNEQRGPMIAALTVLVAIFGFSYELRGAIAVLFLLIAQQARARSHGISSPGNSRPAFGARVRPLDQAR